MLPQRWASGQGGAEAAVERVPERLRELVRSALAEALTTRVQAWWEMNPTGWYNGRDYY